MARSYQSALPTWSTYTPHVSPLGVQAPINQEVFWRNRATQQASLLSMSGWTNRQSLNIANQLRGTGAGAVAAGSLTHRPLMSAALGAFSKRDWARKTQEAVQLQTPEALTEAGESTPQSDMQRRAARTAPPPVNPAAVQQADAARQVAGSLVPKVLADPNAGGSTIKINDKRGTRK